MAHEAPIGARNRKLASVLDLEAGGPHDTPRSSGAIAAMNDANEGVIAYNTIDMQNIPTDNDILTIEDDIYEFIDNSAATQAVTTAGNIGVEILASATLTLDALIDAING